MEKCEECKVIYYTNTEKCPICGTMNTGFVGDDTDYLTKVYYKNDKFVLVTGNIDVIIYGTMFLLMGIGLFILSINLFYDNNLVGGIVVLCMALFCLFCVYAFISPDKEKIAELERRYNGYVFWEHIKDKQANEEEWNAWLRQRELQKKTHGSISSYNRYRRK